MSMKLLLLWPGHGALIKLLLFAYIVVLGLRCGNSSRCTSSCLLCAADAEKVVNVNARSETKLAQL